MTQDKDVNRHFPERKDGQQVDEKMLKNIQHQGNVNRNHETPPGGHQDGNQGHRGRWCRCGRGAAAPPCRAGGMWDGVAAADGRPAFPREVTHRVTVGPGDSTPERWENTCARRMPGVMPREARLTTGTQRKQPRGRRQMAGKQEVAYPYNGCCLALTVVARCGELLNATELYA